jgi:hypothetical protein
MTEFNSKADQSRWTRSHADDEITWWTEAGPGGTIIVHETGRSEHLSGK